MKCEECGGTGKVQKWFYERTGFGKYEKVCGDVKCEWCNGTGEVEQTEEEFIQSCTTEQLADILYNFFMARTFCHICPENNVCDIGYKCKYGTGDKKEDFVLWLKQPHHEKE